MDNLPNCGSEARSMSVLASLLELRAGFEPAPHSTTEVCGDWSIKGNSITNKLLLYQLSYRS